MITTTYNYQETLAASVRANWQVEDIIGGDKRLDFTKPFMPDSLARVNSIEFLRDDEKILLNQIRGYGYLSTFGLVEEFILPFVLDHARPVASSAQTRESKLKKWRRRSAESVLILRISLRPSAYLRDLCVKNRTFTQSTQRYAEGRRENPLFDGRFYLWFRLKHRRNFRVEVSKQ